MSRKHIANQAKYSFMKQSIVRRILLTSNQLIKINCIWK